jgi:hypothetical protein
MKIRYYFKNSSRRGFFALGTKGKIIFAWGMKKVGPPWFTLYKVYEVAYITDACTHNNKH